MYKLLNKVYSSTILQSVTVWAVVFLILFIIQPLSWAGWGFSIASALILQIFLIIVYYTTYKVLIPRFFLKNKKTLYTVVSVILIILLAQVAARIDIYFVRYFAIEFNFDNDIILSMSRFFTFFTLTYAISNIIYFSKRTAEDAKQKEDLLSEKKLLEVRVLKSQINSHFIFNALNNIYSMIYFKDEYISGYVLKLAQMMRYVMEDCDTELTPLSKEIEYIENFIDFQKLRFENGKGITFICDVGDCSGTFLPPMIFQPLVENCFKHTRLGLDEDSYVFISLEMQEQSIRFVSKNSKSRIKNKSNNGIGIENVKRRLDLYYSNYTLDITDDEDCFSVVLIINL